MSLHRAIEEYVESFDQRTVIGEVVVERKGDGFHLYHREDEDRIDVCKELSVDSLRELSQQTAESEFRPLKSAPNLRGGWVCRTTTVTELETALTHLYPGAIADRYALRNGAESHNYRDFTNRQTGMYRITTHPSDEEVNQIADACCDDRFCLKQRLWTVSAEDTQPDLDTERIPCLEPCPILLEFARKVVRISQEEPVELTLAPSEIETLVAGLNSSGSGESAREAEFGNAGNPRRRSLLNDKLKKVLAKAAEETNE